MKKKLKKYISIKRTTFKSKLSLVIIALAIFLGGSLYLAISSGTGPLSFLAEKSEVNVVTQCSSLTGSACEKTAGCTLRTTNKTVTKSHACTDSECKAKKPGCGYTTATTQTKYACNIPKFANDERGCIKNDGDWGKVTVNIGGGVCRGTWTESVYEPVSTCTGTPDKVETPNTDTSTCMQRCLATGTGASTCATVNCYVPPAPPAKSACDLTCEQYGPSSGQCLGCRGAAGSNNPPANTIDAEAACKKLTNDKQTCVYSKTTTPPCKCTSITKAPETPKTCNITPGVNIEAGKYAATGRGLDDKGNVCTQNGCPARECVLLNADCSHGPSVKCHDVYKNDPSKIILPPSAGTEYTMGMTPGDLKAAGQAPAKAKEQCYDKNAAGVWVIVSDGSTKSGDPTQVCFNGKFEVLKDKKTECEKDGLHILQGTNCIDKPKSEEDKCKDRIKNNEPVKWENGACKTIVLKEEECKIKIKNGEQVKWDGKECVSMAPKICSINGIKKSYPAGTNCDALQALNNDPTPAQPITCTPGKVAGTTNTYVKCDKDAAGKVAVIVCFNGPFNADGICPPVVTTPVNNAAPEDSKAVLVPTGVGNNKDYAHIAPNGRRYDDSSCENDAQCLEGSYCKDIEYFWDGRGDYCAPIVPSQPTQTTEQKKEEVTSKTKKVGDSCLNNAVGNTCDECPGEFSELKSGTKISGYMCGSSLEVSQIVNKDYVAPVAPKKVTCEIAANSATNCYDLCPGGIIDCQNGQNCTCTKKQDTVAPPIVVEDAELPSVANQTIGGSVVGATIGATVGFVVCGGVTVALGSVTFGGTLIMAPAAAATCAGWGAGIGALIGGGSSYSNAQSSQPTVPTVPHNPDLNVVYETKKGGDESAYTQCLMEQSKSTLYTCVPTGNVDKNGQPTWHLIKN